MNPPEMEEFSILLYFGFANYTLYFYVDQTNIINHLSGLGKSEVFTVEKIPLEKVLLRAGKI